MRASTATAASIVDQSLADPITTPTTGPPGSPSRSLARPLGSPSRSLARPPGSLMSHPHPLADGVDAQDDPLALDRAGVVVAGVAPRERVDVLAGGVATHLAADRSPHLDVAVRVGSVPDRDRHVGVLLDRLVLGPVQLGVDEQLVLAGVDPHDVAGDLPVGQLDR